jgi:hypothetical protein
MLHAFTQQTTMGLGASLDDVSYAAKNIAAVSQPIGINARSYEAVW